MLRTMSEQSWMIGIHVVQPPRCAACSRRTLSFLVPTSRPRGQQISRKALAILTIDGIHDPRKLVGQLHLAFGSVSLLSNAIGGV